MRLLSKLRSKITEMPRHALGLRQPRRTHTLAEILTDALFPKIEPSQMTLELKRRNDDDKSSVTNGRSTLVETSVGSASAATHWGFCLARSVGVSLTAAAAKGNSVLFPFLSKWSGRETTQRATLVHT